MDQLDDISEVSLQRTERLINEIDYLRANAEEVDQLRNQLKEADDLRASSALENAIQEYVEENLRDRYLSSRSGRPRILLAQSCRKKDRSNGYYYGTDASILLTLQQLISSLE